MLQRIQVFIIIVVLPVAGLLIYANSKGVPLREIFSNTMPIVHLDDIPMQVDIADNDAELQKGLSGRKSLPETRGLLMVFDEPDYHGIWMKDMLFPIDVVWISEDLKIVEITRNRTPDSYPRVFYPPSPVRYVLETNVGYTNTFGVNVGDGVVLPLELRNRD